MPTERAILHVDMDAFFAAIAVLDDSRLRGQPVLTGSNGPRGVVTTASYEARKFGCHSAMPMAQAKRLCPHAQVVQVPGQRIREVSRHLFAILEQFTPLMQPLSVDEAFLDVTGSRRLCGEPVQIARNLKEQIDNELNLIASVGVSFNKFLAKLASDLDKPDGLTVITPPNLDRILLPLPVSKIWGIGPATCRSLERHGVRHIADLRQLTLKQLQRQYGKQAECFYRLCRGIDHRPVVPDRNAKSIGQEQTFGQDLIDPQDVRAFLMTQTEQVGRRLRTHGLSARGMSVKIRFGDYQTITRSATLHRASRLTAELWHAARQLFDMWANQSFSPVRLIGVTATQLTHGENQLDLFCDQGRSNRQKLDQALDQIADRFGAGCVHRGAGQPECPATAPPDQQCTLSNQGQ